MAIRPEHITNAAEARRLYLNAQTPDEARADWLYTAREARRLAASALRASNYMRDVARALMRNGAHALVYRQVLAPPVSQDQFRLLCPSYSKALEKSGQPYQRAMAEDVAVAIEERLDAGITGWIVREEEPNRRDVETFLRVASTLIALQQVSTGRRKRLASEQEDAVINMLKEDGWTKLPSRLIDTRAAVPARHFMHKTRFATATTTPQEVDIACGLGATYVLAMECKVTNDETNSVKRVNDVLKKAESWKKHWGSFVETAALLQGVIGPKDVQRLTDAGVHVFWSHDLDAFQIWLDTRLA